MWCRWENARKGWSCDLDRIHSSDGAGTPRVARELRDHLRARVCWPVKLTNSNSRSMRHVLSKDLRKRRSRFRPHNLERIMLVIRPEDYGRTARRKKRHMAFGSNSPVPCRRRLTTGRPGLVSHAAQDRRRPGSKAKSFFPLAALAGLLVGVWWEKEVRDAARQLARGRDATRQLRPHSCGSGWFAR
jgi:hypothetical protein